MAMRLLKPLKDCIRVENEYSFLWCLETLFGMNFLYCGSVDTFHKLHSNGVTVLGEIPIHLWQEGCQACGLLSKQIDKEAIG